MGTEQMNQIMQHINSHSQQIGELKGKTSTHDRKIQEVEDQFLNVGGKIKKVQKEAHDELEKLKHKVEEIAAVPRQATPVEVKPVDTSDIAGAVNSLNQQL